MKLADISVDRKVTTAMVMLIMVVVGFITFPKLGLDFFPELEFPTVTVITTYSGASSEDVENTLSKPLEQVVSSISRVKKVSSTSSEGVSAIMVEFEWGTNLDYAAQDLREQIGLYKNYLPPGAGSPLVVKFNLAQIPVIFWGITANMPPVEVKKLIEDEIAPRLERIDGVAAAQVFSMDTREILINVDKRALLSYGLSLDRILGALLMDNLNLPAGHLVERHADFLVRTMGEFESLDDVRQTVVGITAQSVPIYLRDIAEVKDTIKETNYSGRIQGQKAVYLFISKRSGANTATVGKAVNKTVKDLLKTLPPDVQFHKAMDQSEMIQEVTSNTVENAWQGALLAIVLIFVFLHNWKPTFIISLVIPLSLILTFICFYIAGFTLNLLTLGGLALGVGNLIDNAIVVIENIYRHLQEGRDPAHAAKVGTSEVGMAITASTLTSCVVFLPLMFAEGITAQLTRPLALSIVFAQVTSLLVALTIVPMLSSILFKKRKKAVESQSMRKLIGPEFTGAKTFYRRILEKALRHRGKVLAGAFGLFIFALALIPFMGTEFIPAQDQHMLMIKIKMPAGTALEETDRVMAMTEAILRERPEVKIISAQSGSAAEDNPQDSSSGINPAGPNEGLLWVSLTDKTERELSDIQILEKIRQSLPRLKNVKFESLNMSQMMMGGVAAPVEIKIYGKDLVKIRSIADDIVARITSVEGLRDITHTLADAKPEYHIHIDRERASRFGLSVSQVATAVQTATLGKVASRYRAPEEEVDIRVRFKPEYRNTLDEIKKIPIASPLNQIVYLDQVAAFENGSGPISIAREDQSRRVSVTANITGRDLGSTVRDIKRKLNGLESQLPSGYFIEYGGSYEQMKEAFQILAGALVLAVLLVYMVMASQFESFLHPFIIMFTIPLCLIGIVGLLLILGKSISLLVGIGMILLSGIAVNNGIVLIDYMNQLKRKGLEKREVILQGAVTRLRPVILTALTTVLGTLPMAFSRSSGAEMRNPLALTLLGGLMTTTFLTLFIIPIIYSLFEKVSFKN